MEANEIWFPIPGYEGFYEISSHGRIKSLDRYIVAKNKINPVLFKGRMLKYRDNGTRYLQIELNKEGSQKLHYVHRLVALSFIGFSTLPVDHINHDKKDNRLENLQYLTTRENQCRRILSKVKKAPLGSHWIESRKRYRASISYNGKNIHLGYFILPEDAHSAYIQKLKQILDEY